MDSVEYLVIGAGVTGLSFANSLRESAAAAGNKTPELLIVEADGSAGGYCKTIKQDGFVWDYSGHFFHFKHAEIEQWLRQRMPGQDIRTVEKASAIRFKGRNIDFPFQKNIHQLPRQDFIDCLVDLYFRAEQYGDAEPTSFQDMLYQKFGRGIAEAFLIPYNEKLYATDLASLDPDAMGRFFPHADIADIIRNMRQADNRSYNATFSYPAGGAIEYINALLHDLPDGLISYQERLLSVDPERKIATTSKREIRFDKLISSAPLNRLAAATQIAHDADAFSWNKVLVFNLGFDRKGDTDVHWMYFPDRERVFYRVGWYDNIMSTDRMSLYVEIGATAGETLDVEAQRQQVLADLAKEQIVVDHELVSWHTVTLDPAYVHITQRSLAEHKRLAAVFKQHDIYSAGRYGRWTYCSIEDNMLEARHLAADFVAARL